MIDQQHWMEYMILGIRSNDIRQTYWIMYLIKGKRLLK